MLQVLINPEQLRVMAGGDDPDQGCPVIHVRPVGPGGPESSTYPDDGTDVR
jgi:hypothetical protein